MRKLTVAIAIFVILAAGGGVLAGKTPVDVTGAEFVGDGKLKGKVKGFGSEKGPAGFRLAFGARAGLPSGRFQLTLDDGVDTIVIPGAYALDEKGRKYVLTPDAPALVAAMNELFWRYAGGEIPGVSIDIDVTKIKIAPKPKVQKKTGMTTLKLKAKFQLVVTASALGQSQTVRTTFQFQGKSAGF